MKYLEEKPEGTIFVIPVRLDDCELPHFIREIQWVDHPGDYDRLVMSLQVRAGGSAMPKKLQNQKRTNQQASGPPPSQRAEMFSMYKAASTFRGP